jgi:hypothetical protein
MRIASRFERPGRSSDRHRRALAAGGWVALFSLGCFFELEPLADPPPDGLGGGGSAGGVAGDAGEASTGGDGVGGVGGTPVAPGGCDPGQKRCDGVCVAATPQNGCSDPECTACPLLPNAVAPSCGGDSGRCQITGCDANFADCDGDLLAYNNGESSPEGPGRGCEYSFGNIADSTQLLTVPRTQQMQLDGSRDDWGGIPAYKLEHTCVDCNDVAAVFQPTAQNEAPPESDLSAYFRVAWDGDRFYVLAEAFDDQVFNAGATVDNGTCRTNGDYVPGPICEDAFAVYFDGAPESERNKDYGNVAHRIFLGSSGVSFAPNQAQPPTGSVDVRVLSIGPRCYRIEAQFDWNLLVSNQDQPVPGKFPPAGGQSYGFDIAVSDWDPALSDPSAFERQSELFWTPRAPQSVLYPSIAGGGNIVLTDHSAGQTPQ